MEPIGALPREVEDANSLKDMVGPCGLEPQTSTVSKIVSVAAHLSSSSLAQNLFAISINTTSSKFSHVLGQPA